MIRDVLWPALLWWLTLTVIGWAALPMAWRLFGVLPDRGLAFVRPLGLLLAGYAYWVAVTAGILPNSRAGAAAAVLGVAAVGAWLAAEDRERLSSFLRANRRLIAGYEGLFLVVLVAWAVVRAYAPNIEPAGGEKFMEMAFINSTLRSVQFPPLDPWLSGFAISYYYFGYVLAAMVVQLTGLLPSLAFNLVIPGTLAMTCVAAFGLGWDLVSLTPGASRAARWVGGALTALLLALIGNLIGAIELGFMQGVPSQGFYRWLAIKDLTPGGICDTTDGGFGAGGLVPSRFIWWWRASRVIHDNCGEIIHEFPFFSFLLGDVHPHVVALPFVLTVLALALAALAGGFDRLLDRRRAGDWALLALVAVVVGSLGFLNTWDLPTFGLVLVVAFGLRCAALQLPAIRRDRADLVVAAGGLAAVLALAWAEVPRLLAALRGVPVEAQPPLARAALALAVTLAIGGSAYAVWGRALDGHKTAGLLVHTGRLALWLAFLSVALYAPFYIGFRSQASGLALSTAHSRLPQWLVHFGFLATMSGTVVVAWWPAVRRAHTWWPSWLVAAVLLPVAALALLLRAWTPMLEALMAFGALWVGLELWHGHVQQLAGGPDPVEEARPGSRPGGSAQLDAWSVPAVFTLSCVALGLVLALIPEFAYVRDLFNSRMNTVFKLFYQAWVLLAVGGAFAARSVWSRWSAWARSLWSIPFGVLLAASLLYPLQALYTRTDGLAHRAITLDGLAYWKTTYPDDLAAAEWLRANAPPNAVLVEAYGGAYEYDGRMSMASGVPAVLGWEGHEHQWRGTREQIDPRKTDIEVIYTSPDAAVRRQLLERYNVRYIVLGDPERAKFQLSDAQVARLRSEFTLAFQGPEGRTQILERR